MDLVTKETLNPWFLLAGCAILSVLWCEYVDYAPMYPAGRPLILSLFLPLALSLQARNIIMGIGRVTNKGLQEIEIK